MTSFSEEDIVVLCDKIFQNLQISFELEDLAILLEEKIYIELYRIMFPYLEEYLLKIESQNIKVGDKIQALIDLLSSQVLNMDLSHIKGANIVSGDKKHILNFLQLLFEVSRLLHPSGNNEENNPNIRSAPLSVNSSRKNSIRRHTVQGVNDEFPSEMAQNEGDPEHEHEPPIEILEPELNEEFQNNDNEHDEFHCQEDLFDENEEIKEEDLNNEKNSSKNIIKEVSKSEESSEYEKSKKKSQKKSNENKKKSSKQSEKKFSSKGKENSNPLEDISEEKFNDYEKKMARNKSKNNLVEELISTKEMQKKQLGKSLFTKKTMNTRVLTKSPQMQNTQNFQKRPQTSKVKANALQQSESPLEENFEKAEISKKVEEIGSDYAQFNANMYEILTDNISKIRESLKSMRNKKLNDDDIKTQQQLIRQKNEYKQLLKEYLDYNKSMEKKTVYKSNQDEKFFLSKIGRMQKKEKNFQEIIENEEKGLFLKLRDEKINYLRKIHRIIFELEKRKIIDENKQYKDSRKLKNEETRCLLESIENSYKDKITILKEKIINQRKEQSISNVAHRQVLSKLERELKEEKMKQMSDLKEMWRCEKEKFDLLVMDDGQLEQKIMDLYKKY